MLPPSKKYCIVTTIFAVLAIASSQVPEECIVTEFSQVAGASATCRDIIVRNLTAPAGNTLHFYLMEGATLTFEGRTTFEYFQWPEWDHYLVQFHGTNITVQGAPGSVLDGQGALYWDGLGDTGVPKPYFIGISVVNSVLRDINLLNCPHHCTLINDTDGVTISNWDIDCSYGEGRGGHNTDGFDIVSGRNVVIKDSSVVNQDDCVAINQGFNMHISGMFCNGTHGVSLSVGFSKTSHYDNTLRNVTYSNCTLVNSDNAIHIKTHNDGGPGVISDVTYENIRFSDIHNYGINIQEDYANGGSTGILKGNVPINNLVFRDIKGTLSGNGMPVYIFCADDGCLDWTWSEISVTGGSKPSQCNYQPDGYTC